MTGRRRRWTLALAAAAVCGAVWWSRPGRMPTPAWAVADAWPVAAFDGGRSLAVFVRRGGVPQLWSLDPRTGGRRAVIEAGGWSSVGAALPDGRLLYGRNGPAAAVCVWDGADSRVVATRGPSTAADALAADAAGRGAGPPRESVAGVRVRGGVVEVVFETAAAGGSEAVLTQVRLDAGTFAELGRRDHVADHSSEFLRDAWWTPGGFGAEGFAGLAEEFGPSDRPLTAEQLRFASTAAAGETLAVAAWYRRPDWRGVLDLAGLRERTACVVWRREGGRVRRILDARGAAFPGWHTERVVLSPDGRRLFVGLSRPPFGAGDQETRCYELE